MLVKLINAGLTVVYGIGGALILYYLLNKVAEALPDKWEQRVKPYLYVLPAFAAISVYLVYPTVQTIIYSFGNASSTQWVGARNYTELLGNGQFQDTLVNTLLWVAFAPVITIVAGLLIAVLTDRLKPRVEKTAKTLFFLPMAISAVGAATIWRFVYAANPPTNEQVGILNGIVSALGGHPVAWLQLSQGKVNTFLIMVIFLWAQVGFSMVLLSAAIKSVPTETLEAARIDGARETQIFFRVVVPQIWGTVLTVYITVTIGVMKIFDIVYVMTNGNFNTNIIGTQFFNELFTNFNNGHAAAIVVMLLVAIVPILIFQIRHARSEGAGR